jgi:hypothetical protein
MILERPIASSGADRRDRARHDNSQLRATGALADPPPHRWSPSPGRRRRGPGQAPPPRRPLPTPDRPRQPDARRAAPAPRRPTRGTSGRRRGRARHQRGLHRTRRSRTAPQKRLDMVTEHARTSGLPTIRLHHVRHSHATAALSSATHHGRITAPRSRVCEHHPRRPRSLPRCCHERLRLRPQPRAEACEPEAATPSVEE